MNRACCKSAGRIKRRDKVADIGIRLPPFGVGHAVPRGKLKNDIARKRNFPRQYRQVYEDGQ